MKLYAAIVTVFAIFICTLFVQVSDERDYLRRELFVSLGFAERATETAEQFSALAEQYHAEITELRYDKAQTRLASYIRKINPRAPADRIATAIVASARAHDIPVAFVAGVVKVESHFNPAATGSAKERGLMQILPSTAREIGPGCYTYRIEANIECGVQYLKSHLEKYGSPDLAANRYNGGGDSAYRVRVMAARDAIRRYGV